MTPSTARCPNTDTVAIHYGHRHALHRTSWQGSVDFPEYMRRLEESTKILEDMIARQVFCWTCAVNVKSELELAYGNLSGLTSAQCQYAHNQKLPFRCAYHYVCYNSYKCREPEIQLLEQRAVAEDLWESTVRPWNSFLTTPRSWRPARTASQTWQASSSPGSSPSM